MKLRVGELPLHVSSTNAASYILVETVEELCHLSLSYLLKNRGYARPIYRIEACLRELGLSFADTPNERFLERLAERRAALRATSGSTEGPSLEELITRDFD